MIKSYLECSGNYNKMCKLDKLTLVHNNIVILIEL